MLNSGGEQKREEWEQEGMQWEGRKWVILAEWQIMGESL